MIGRILKSGSFGSKVDYVTREKHDKRIFTPDTWKILGSDGLLGTKRRQIIASFESQSMLNHRISNPAGHITLSFAAEDRPKLTDKKMLQIAKDYIKMMGLDKITEINNTIGTIPKQPIFPTTAPEPQPAEPLEIHLPDDLAKSEDINRLFGMVQTFNSTLTLTLQGLGEIKKGFEALTKLDMQEVADKAATGAAQKMSHEVIKTLVPKIEDSARDALNRGALKSPGISLDDASAINSRLGRMEKSLELRDRTEWYKKRFRKLMTLHAVIVGLLCAAIWWAFDLKEQRDELLKIEWLYRLERVISPNADFTNRIEKEILKGSDETREAWQSIIVEKEKSGTEFLYFHPHDDWTLEPQDEQPHSLKKVATEKKVKETDPAKMDCYELLEENMRRAKNGEHIIDPKTRK